MEPLSFAKKIFSFKIKIDNTVMIKTINKTISYLKKKKKLRKGKTSLS